VHSLRQAYHMHRNLLDTPDGTLGDGAQMEARFGSFGGSANLDLR
jgi:hypothetical protein